MYKITQPRILQAVDVLADLPDRLYDNLFVDAPLRHLKAEKVLFSVGDVGDGCYRLEQGLLKVTLTSLKGEERVFAILGPGAIVGEMSMIDGLPRAISVIAFDDCTLRFVSRQNFTQHLQTHPETCQHLMTILASRLRLADQALAAMSFLPLKGRVARALLEFARHVGHEDEAGHIILRHKISQADLAAMAGVARENVNRTMSEWQERNIVVRSSNYYQINDRKALERELEYGE